jgi:uncharacterized membrane protein
MSILRSTASARRRRGADVGGREAGIGIFGTLFGFVIFMVLLLFAVQVVVRLYATSTLSSVAIRAAQSVAQSPLLRGDVAHAEAVAKASLGSFGSAHTQFLWKQVDGHQVVLELRATPPEFLPGLPGWNQISRTVTVRTERFR